MPRLGNAQCTIWQAPAKPQKLILPKLYRRLAIGLPGRGNFYATLKRKAAELELDGFTKFNEGRQCRRSQKSYCSGGLVAELGFTERMKVMIFHS